MKFNPGCRCCICTENIGQPVSGHSSLNHCCAGEVMTTELNDDITQIDEQHTMQVGFAVFNGELELFDEAYWPDIADWVIAGGKLIVWGMSEDTIVSGTIADLNDFLADIGSTMSFVDDGVCSGGTSSRGTLNTLPITAGAAPVYILNTRIVSGGTWIVKTNGQFVPPNTDLATVDCPVGEVAIAGEYLGDGFILAATVGVLQGDPVNRFCKLMSNLFELPANAIL